MTGDFGGFQQMWSNPQFQGFGPWQNAFPLQFMPQMMQGSQMQFPPGPFPGQFQQMIPQTQSFNSQRQLELQDKSNQGKGSGSNDVSQSGSTHAAVEKATDTNQMKKASAPGGSVSSNGLTFDMKFKGVICYNCGEPCHYVGMCQRQKKCFICGSHMHHMDKCPEWYRSIPMAQFYGSANTGLGFFHVEVDKPAAVAWLNLDNVGIAVVDGDISMDELKQNFSEIWKTNWPWQMRQLEGNKFLVRFPPWKKDKRSGGFSFNQSQEERGFCIFYSLGWRCTLLC
jgi:hypothetical protein